MKLFFFVILLILDQIVVANAVDHVSKIHDTKTSTPLNIQVVDPWVPTAPTIAKNHAAYMILINKSKKNKTIIAASSPQYVKAEIHLSKIANGIATMKQLNQINLPAGSKTHFKPGGLHIMLMKPKRRMKTGDIVAISLFLNDDTKIQFKAEVRNRNKKYMHMHHQGHK